MGKTKHNKNNKEFTKNTSSINTKDNNKNNNMNNMKNMNIQHNNSINSSKTKNKDPSTHEDSQKVAGNSKPSSWAALFEQEKKKLDSSEFQNKETEENEQRDSKINQGKRLNKQKGNQTTKTKPTATSTPESKISTQRFYTKGLQNISNSCFINAVLQILMNCPLFVQILSNAKKYRNVSSFPVTSAFIKIMNEMMTKSKPGTTRSVANGKQIFKLFRTKSTLMQEGNQEDAEELLNFILHELHEEFLKIENSSSSSKINVEKNESNDENINEDDDDEGWEEVTSKKSSVKVQKHKMQESSITKTLGGQFRSIAKSRGKKGTLNVEPFLTLPLDLNQGNVESIKQALKLFASPEDIEGQRKTQKKVMIERLPPVLILQLKRFIYTPTGGIEKLSEFVEYPFHLNLDPSIVPPHKVPKNNIQRQYQLISVICHGGNTVNEGHYVSFIQTKEGEWFGYDDEMIEEVDKEVVLDQQAYLLVYLNKSRI